MSNPAKVSGVRRITDDAVTAKTDRGWADWFAPLDGWDAVTKGRTTSAR